MLYMQSRLPLHNILHVAKTMNKSSLNFYRYYVSLLWKVPGVTEKTLDNKKKMKHAIIIIKVTVYFLIFSKYGSCAEFIIRDLKL